MKEALSAAEEICAGAGEKARRKTKNFENGMIWFGAAIGLAEIQSGTYLAPLGFGKGLLSILIGHVIGCLLLFLAGCIGGKTRKSAMETVTISFGQKGAWLFAFLNVLQLIGWTAIMIYDGALAAGGIWNAGNWIWAVVIGGLILIWILVGITSLGKVNLAAMGALFLLTILLSAAVFGGHGTEHIPSEMISMGAAIELSVAMPVSWVPLISDYTRDAEKPVQASAVSAAVYGVTSCWMYVIGMGAAIFAETSDIAAIMLKAGMGAAGLLIVVLATVTTTFLDVYSAGISGELFSEKINGKWISVAAVLIGTAAAVFYPLDNITGFLYFIGSVFSPMIAIMIADLFLHRSCEEKMFSVENLLIWAAGFLLYRKLMTIDLPVGSTLVDIAMTMILCGVVSLFVKNKGGKV